jgi:hypothetical protein
MEETFCQSLKKNNMAFKYKMGLEAKDKVTGYTGFITSRTQYITGCDGYGLMPTVSEGNKVDDGRIFDENRLKITGPGLSEDPSFASDGMSWDDIQAEEAVLNKALSKSKKDSKKSLVKGGPHPEMKRIR